MGVFSNKISRENLKAGDHIYSWRTAYVYAHHSSISIMALVILSMIYSFSTTNVISLAGIYVGDGKVIYYTRGGGRQTETGTFFDKFIVSSSLNITPCLIYRDRSNSDGVISSCLDCFLAGGNLYLFEYDVSWFTILAKPRSGMSTLAPSDPPEEVLSRANFLLVRNGFGVFDVLENNCEDFAIYCKTGLVDCDRNGLGMSGQVNSVGAASFAALVVGFGGLPLAGVGTYCVGRLAGDIGMPRPTVIKVPVEKLVANYAMRQGIHVSLFDNNLVRQGRYRPVTV